EHHVAEGVSVRREDEEVHAGVGGGKLFAAQHARELCPAQPLAKPGLVTAVADDEETEVLYAHAFELLLDLDQKRDVLLDREPAHEAEHGSAAWRFGGALQRIKQLGVNAARHQVTGAVGALRKLVAELGVGREEHPRAGVEERSSGQRKILNFFCGRGDWRSGSRRRNQSERRARYSCTLVCQL